MWNSLSRGSPASGDSWKMDTRLCANITKENYPISRSAKSPPRPRFSVKLSYQYSKSQCGDTPVVRSSHIHDGNSYSGTESILNLPQGATVQYSGHHSQTDQNVYQDWRVLYIWTDLESCQTTHITDYTGTRVNSMVLERIVWYWYRNSTQQPSRCRKGMWRVIIRVTS